MKIIIVFLGIVTSLSLFSRANEDSLGLFSGRVAKINSRSYLMRIKVDFSNMKYINKKDKIEFWNPHHPGFRCSSYVIGKSNDYLLLKIPSYKLCMSKVSLLISGYLHFYSGDLVNNMKMGKSLVKILIKKRLALGGKLRRNQKELDRHIEKVEALNARYTTLKKRLLAEWNEELVLLDEDKTTTLQNYKNLELRINEIDEKLVKYRVEDENMKVDRWSLDHRLFYKK